MSRLTTRELATAALFTAILSVAAFVAIPVGSVPFTLQVYFVLLAGMVLGPRLGVLSVLAYLILGLFAPVYAGGTSGLGALFGPTGGYLFGFIGAAFVAGLIVERGARSSFEALKELRMMAGSTLDARYVEILAKVLRDKDLAYRDGSSTDFMGEYERGRINLRLRGHALADVTGLSGSRQEDPAAG